ncbi:hypothetical protein A8F94_19190 [Bacillus sp. FJAT-27225]|uniref:hypothetical protein n=1 Tax=Bacillus sp. FJAT-27225 TaxID=1743144 RepID=UPI00080C29CC|nr:hypothetical protein [Bacillus sp. FJAT-27225]OCA83233.1 hypothetical protein A8F94_19190 [Bacillus sp. FJAT-27225]
MLDQEFLQRVKEYILDHQQPIVMKSSYKLEESSESSRHVLNDIPPLEIEEFIKGNRKRSLREVLFSYIDKKGAADSEVYKKAGIDRRLFSKIRSNPEYRPGKNTVIALALALELNLKETDKLLNSVGYSLSDSETGDLVIKYFIEHRIYDIYQVNETLEYFSAKPLGGVL